MLGDAESSNYNLQLRRRNSVEKVSNTKQDSAKCLERGGVVAICEALHRFAVSSCSIDAWHDICHNFIGPLPKSKVTSLIIRDTDAIRLGWARSTRYARTVNTQEVLSASSCSDLW